MTEVLKWAGLIAAGFVVLSLAVGIPLGMLLRRRGATYPVAKPLHLVSDERYAEQAGEQR